MGKLSGTAQFGLGDELGWDLCQCSLKDRMVAVSWVEQLLSKGQLKVLREGRFMKEAQS